MTTTTTTIHTVKKIFSDAIQCVLPMSFMKKYVRIEMKDNIPLLWIGTDRYYNLSTIDHVLVLGAGKASAAMLHAFLEIYPTTCTELSEPYKHIPTMTARVITKYDHSKKNLQKILQEAEKRQQNRVTAQVAFPSPHTEIWDETFQVFEAAHPVPDMNSLKYTKELITAAQAADENTLILFLLSGGGSALFEQPRDGITLSDLQSMNQTLLGAGASIDEINVVRKHLSTVKGGQFAKICAPAQLETVMISDVVGDSVETIASGPTVPNSSIPADLVRVIDRYDLYHQLSTNVKEVWKEILASCYGTSNGNTETTKESDTANAPTDPISEGMKSKQTAQDEYIYTKKCNYSIVASNRSAVEMASKAAISAGYETLILSTTIEGDTVDVADQIAYELEKLISGTSTIPEIEDSTFSEQNLDNSSNIEGTSKVSTKRICLLWGGETTMKLPTRSYESSCLGGRSQHMALLFSKYLNELQCKYPNLQSGVILCGGTDGTDGPTDAAGAVVTTDTFRQATNVDLDTDEHLNRYDSYHFFQKFDQLMCTVESDKVAWQDSQRTLVKTGATGTNVMDIGIALLSFK